MEVAAGNIGQVSTHGRPGFVRAMLVGFFAWFGQIGAFCGRVSAGGRAPPYEWRELLGQCDLIGSLSLPLGGAATGVANNFKLDDSKDQDDRLGEAGGRPLLGQVEIMIYLTAPRENTAGH